MYLDFSFVTFQELINLMLYIFKWVNVFDVASEYLHIQLRNLEVFFMMEKFILDF